MIKSSAYRPFATDAPTTLSPGSSPFTYTNTSGKLQEMIISGGLLVTVSLGGLSLGLTSAGFPVRPNDVVTVTFTAAPQIRIMNIM